MNGQKLDIKPVAPACERNQAVILEQLKQQLRAEDRLILEIGSGTGQHAVYFGEHLKHITWQTSDVQSNHPGIQMWLDEAELSNVLSPLGYEIGQTEWPNCQADVIFSANVLHIISMEMVKQFMRDLGENLRPGNRVMFYGPFKYRDEYTSESNADFDLWLKDKDPKRGIRDFEHIEQMMQQQGFTLVQDIAMPANNQLLIFEKL